MIIGATMEDFDAKLEAAISLLNNVVEVWGESGLEDNRDWSASTATDIEEQEPSVESKTYTYVYEEPETHPDDKCNFYLRSVKRKSKKGTAGVGRDDGVEINKEYTDCSGKEEEPAALRIISSMRALKAMEEIQSWENKNLIHSLRQSGAEINTKGCAQGTRIPRKNKKFQIPGPWIQCPMNHFTTSGYAFNKKISSLIKPQMLPNEDPNSLTPRSGLQVLQGLRAGRRHKPGPPCTNCRYWKFEHYKEPDMYYNDYLEKVTSLGRYRASNPTAKINFEAIAKDKCTPSFLDEGIILANEEEYRDLLNPAHYLMLPDDEQLKMLEKVMAITSEQVKQKTTRKKTLRLQSKYVPGRGVKAKEFVQEIDEKNAAALKSSNEFKQKKSPVLPSLVKGKPVVKKLASKVYRSLVLSASSIPKFPHVAETRKTPGHADVTSKPKRIFPIQTVKKLRDLCLTKIDEKGDSGATRSKLSLLVRAKPLFGKLHKTTSSSQGLLRGSNQKVPFFPRLAYTPKFKMGKSMKPKKPEQKKKALGTKKKNIPKQSVTSAAATELGKKVKKIKRKKVGTGRKDKVAATTTASKQYELYY